MVTGLCVCVVVRLLFFSARAGAQGRTDGVIRLVCGGKELGLTKAKKEILLNHNSLSQDVVLQNFSPSDESALFRGVIKHMLINILIIELRDLGICRAMYQRQH